MAKSFMTAFEAWKTDKAYDIGPDIGTEHYDHLEAPTASKALQHHGKSHSTETIQHPR